MEKRDELNEFLAKADELINSKYILADVKIIGLLKAIASSETLIALFKTCLTDYDYEEAKKTYLIKSPYLSEDKGEFILPVNSKELLALVFNILLDIDAKRISLPAFLNKYFYEYGSSVASYSSFINDMIKPFVKTVKDVMENVLDGKVQDPIEAVIEEEDRKAKRAVLAAEEEKKQKEIEKKKYGNCIKTVKEILLKNKLKIKDSKLKEGEKHNLLLLIDMLANVVESEDADAVEYAFIAYKYARRVHPFLLSGYAATEKAIGGIINGLNGKNGK